MKKTILKSLLLGAVALTALTTWAENKVYVVDFEIKANNTAYVNLVLENESDYIKSWQAILVASEGLTIAKAFLPKDMTESAYPYVDETYDGSINYSANYPEEGQFKVMCVMMKGVPMLKGHKYLAKLQVKAASTFTGNGQIDVKYFKAAADDPDNDCVLNNPETPYKAYLAAQVPEITLANLVANGEENKVYKITDDLNNVVSTAKGEQIMVTDGNGNWMRVICNDEESLFLRHKQMSDFKANTLIGTLNNVDGNQTFTVYNRATSGTTPVDGSVVSWNLAQSDVNSPQWHFRPKVNEVINLQGYYNAEEGKLTGYASGGGQYVTLGTKWADALGVMDLEEQNGNAVNLKKAIVLIKEPWTSTRVAADDVHAYENYDVQMTGFDYEEDVVTGVENLNSEKAVVSVQYVNVAGQISSTPFDGVNMVVTRYADGSTVTTKVIK